MKRIAMTGAACALTFGMLASPATAQDTNTRERSFLTFSNSVELPGVTLEAGTYVFRLADIPTRNVVQVLSQDEKKMMGQWLFVPSQRTQVSQDTVVMFKEQREGTTPAVQYWYYPGEAIGKEFIYPKEQAQKIAARTGANVLSDDGRVTAEQAAAPAPAPMTPQLEQTTAANASAAQPVVADPAPAAAPMPQADRAVGTSGANQSGAVGTSGQAESQVASELPRTASPVPMAGLMGLLALAGVAGTRIAAAARR